MNTSLYNSLGKKLLFDLVDIVNKYCRIPLDEFEIMYYAIAFRGLLEYLPSVDISSATIPKFRTEYMSHGYIEEYSYIWNIPPYCQRGSYRRSIYRAPLKQIKIDLNLF